jgi:aspartate racemase
VKTLGIVGGIGPESTIEYYRSLVAAYRARERDGSYPHVIINSIDMKRLVDLITANELAGVCELLAGEVRTLERAGADFGLLAANTPHIVFDELRRLSPIPLVSIVEATRDAAQAMGLTRVGLFGTRFTMRARFYRDAFAGAGVTLVVPDEGEQDYIHEKYMGELVPGVFLPETRARLLSIADRMIEREGIEGLILGGTELPLILRDETHGGIPLLDTTRIHVNAAVAQL